MDSFFPFFSYIPSFPPFLHSFPLVSSFLSFIHSLLIPPSLPFFLSSLFPPSFLPPSLSPSFPPFLPSLPPPFPSQVLNEKIRELNQGDPSLAKTKLIKKPRFPVYASNVKHIKGMYSAIREFRDSEGRQLSEVFMKLPSKALYPDYYEVRQ